MARIDPRIAAAAIAAAVAVSAPLAQKWEGLVLKARPDPVGILTGCYGETEDIDPSRIYSQDECATKLRKRMARDYAPPILACVPAFAKPEHRHAFAASIDASYNAGPVAFCKSPMAKAFNAGNWRTGCAAFKGWYVSARDRRTGVRKVYRGLVNRRLDESALCLKDLP